MSDFIRITSYQPKDYLYYTEITGINKAAKKLEFKGVFIENIGEPMIHFKNKTAKITDYVGGIGSFSVISTRFKNVLSELPDSNYLQFIKCKSNHSKQSEEFWIMNILELVDCFDWEKSDYTKERKHINPNEFWPDNIKRVEMLNDKINGRNIFRMLDDPTSIFISKYLENIILEQRLKLTLIRTQDLTQFIDADPENPKLARWGHENIEVD